MGSEQNSETARTAASVRYLSELLDQSGQALFPNIGEALLQSIVDAAGQIFGAAAASIALVNDEQKVLEFKVSYGEGNEDVVGQRIPLDTGIAGYVVMTGQPIAIADVQEDPRFNQEFAKSTGYVPKSILATPLEWQERVIGVMEVLDKIEAPRFDLRDMELLGLFAQQASVAIVQSQHYGLISDMFLEGISTWIKQDAPEDLRPSMEQLLKLNSGIPHKHDLTQFAAVLYELVQAGEEERRMTLNVLEAIHTYLVARSSQYRL